MYIKQVIIEGFKSYKSRTVLGPFHQKLNVIVGANGSGKTNILYAIQFVITDQFSYLSKDVRRNLIFSGSGVRCQCASVNIILNNFDNQLPVETEEVSLCRKIGLTFDKLYVNGKQTTHKEMKNLLIAAGFSTCNPFYLVKQGKVCELAAASDAHRLTVLLEAFGDRDSEEIIRKSKAYLNENELKMKIVKSFLNNLHEKLALLEEDRDNLKAFNELQRMKTTMEACLFQRELVEIEKDLHAVEKSYLETLRSQNEYRESQQHVFEEIKETKVLLEKTEKQLKDLKNKRDKFKKDKQLLQAEIDEIVLEISMLKDLEIKNADDQKVYLQNKIEELNIQMIKNEEALKLMKSEHDKMEIKEKEITRRIEEMKQNREELFDKLGRCNQFKSKEERDAWLKNELRSIQKTSSDIRLKKDNLEKEVLEASEKIKKLENEIKDLKNTINQKLLQVEELGKFLNDLLKIRTEGQSMLRELFQEEALCEQKSSSLKDDLPKSRRTLYSVAHRNSIAGLEGLQKVLESLQESGDTTVEGYYGMVIDNLDCDESLFKAVEVTAGKK
ncbi:Structural maintenance of chromosomes protein 3 [Blattella germanica]|nr:Structural maintenance of chromosomes protein 3 [Blattella germanica]